MSRRALAAADVNVEYLGHTHHGQLYILVPFAYWRNAYFTGLYYDRESGAHIYVSSGVNFWVSTLLKLCALYRFARACIVMATTRPRWRRLLRFLL